jgi:GH15 family glucan-1,4-alpha-glucosidase
LQLLAHRCAGAHRPHRAGTRNPLGLLSEDTDARTGELWGNFPQTYSMVGIINGAVRLSAPWESVV